MIDQQLRVGQLQEGTCTAWFHRGQGYGFLKVEGTDVEVFVPARNIINVGALKPGDRVRFRVSRGRDCTFVADGVEVR